MRLPFGILLIIANQVFLVENSIVEVINSVKVNKLWSLIEQSKLAMNYKRWLQNIKNGIVEKVTSFEQKFGHKTNTDGLDTNNSMFGNISAQFPKRLKAIFPGTRWCGDDNIANSNSQLGYFKQTDMCCREHDFCNDYIIAGDQKYGLHNTGLFTRSHCECDAKFYRCLKEIYSLEKVVSSNIGFTFFSLLGPQCFKFEYPITGCRTKKMGRCISYEFDTTKETYAQWFDNPTYLLQ